MTVNCIAALALACTAVVSYPYANHEQNWSIVFSTQFAIALSLLSAVIIMRRAIKKTNFAMPNETLVLCHVINFLVLTIATGSLAIMSVMKGDSQTIDKVRPAQYTIGTLTSIFLLYLTVKFMREVNNTTATIKDPILGKQVPNFVLMQNQELLREALDQQ